MHFTVVGRAQRPWRPTMRSRSRGSSSSARCHSPRVQVASISRPSRRRTSAVVRTCEKFSSTAMRVETSRPRGRTPPARIGQPLGRVVVARDQSPQLALAHQRDDEGRGDAHVLQVLQVQRRHAAQPAHRHVELVARRREQARHQRNRLVVDVDQHAHAVAQIQFARALRNVGLRIVQAEVGLEVRFLGLGDDFAVTVRIEAIEHHAVVAGELAEDRHRLDRERVERRRGAEARDRAGSRCGRSRASFTASTRSTGSSSRMHRVGAVAVDQRLEAAPHAVALRVAAQRSRRCAHAGQHARPDLRGQVAAQDVDRLAEQLARRRSPARAPTLALACRIRGADASSTSNAP